MIRISLVMFLLGVVVTAAVYEITGMRVFVRDWLPTSGGAAQQTASSPASDSSIARRRPLLPLQSPALTAAGSSTARPDDDSSKLRARAEFAEGQLAASEGTSSVWPADVRPEYRRPAVEQQLQKFVVERGLATIDHLECSEYPCVSVLKMTQAGEEGQARLHKALREMAAVYGGKVALSISVSGTGSGADATSMAGVAVSPDEQEVKTRTQHRTNRELEVGSQ